MNRVYGFIKPLIDAHTMGIVSVADLIEECGFRVIIANNEVALAVQSLDSEVQQRKLVNWIIENGITNLGISYRLDPLDARLIVNRVVSLIKKHNLFCFQGGFIDSISYGGLPESCRIIEAEHKGLVKTFMGGESVRETLIKNGIPEINIPVKILGGSVYDDSLLSFGREVISKQEYQSEKPNEIKKQYRSFGTMNDTINARICNNVTNMPLFRAHVGPYNKLIPREENVAEFIRWSKVLAEKGYLDVLSIGSSQLSQSNFGECWDGLSNGGGVPVNDPEEYSAIWEASRPMLVRTYSGTSNIESLAKMYDKTMNNCWHALSLWWFNQLDGRGPNDLKSSLLEHFQTLDYLSKYKRSFEANVSHHFSFRGGDDLTYIVSAYLSAKLAKLKGIRFFILQNMLNTPRLTWGLQDLAKSRALLSLVRTLEDSNFTVYFQPRAGLDYFKPDLDQGRIQLAAVSALMDDIEPNNLRSPDIVHVVSFSEALFLATPEIINESIQIVMHSIKSYRDYRKKGLVANMSDSLEVQERTFLLLEGAKQIINAIENSVRNPYSVQGFYEMFTSGFLPTPNLWNRDDEFLNATFWGSKFVNGGFQLVDRNGQVVSLSDRIEFAKSNLTITSS